MIDDWKSGTASADDVRAILEQIRRDMERSSNRRRSIRDSRRTEIARNHKERDYIVDPEDWRSQFEYLIGQGLTDLTIGYWRVSTKKQEDGEGPETQQQAVIAFSVANAERGVDLWVCDVDSGKEESRVGLTFLSEAIRTGKVKRIVVQRLDRIARNQLLAETLNLEAFKASVQICSATEHIPDGPAGTFFRQIIQAMAQYEATLIVARMRDGKRVRIRREGTYAGGEVPYGYLAAGKGYMVVCEPEARIVQLIFVLFERGFNQSAIAEALNRWGLTTRQRGALGWRQGQIRRILAHEAAYRGEGLFSRMFSKSDRIAHQAILEHRPERIRTYLLGTVKSVKLMAVPDDFLLENATVRRMPGAVASLTASQAHSLQTLFSLRESGMSFRSVAEELNRRGLQSVSGKTWKWGNVQQYYARKGIYAMAIAAAGVTANDVADYVDPGVAEARGVARIHDLRARGLSYHSIQVVLITEKLKTARGADWSLSSIQRVITGKPRQALQMVA